MAKQKIKTHKGTQKRIKITKKGKLLFDKAGNNHLLTNKGKNNKKYKYGKQLAKSEHKSVKALLPYGNK